jgi:uncharacterized membrane protein YphA (DoxX/SURF4 family)
MRTDPFTDAWGFLIGATADHQALGAARYLIVALFIALLAASAAIALANWRADPGQRTAAHLWTWLFRVLLGIMWFQGSLWKLPLPDAAGLQYWTEQMAEHAAFPFYADLVRHVMLPHMTIVDPLVFLAEMGLAVSFMLGFAVKPIATLGAMYTLGLWIGLYRHPGEWPWEYIFLAVAQGLLAVHGAGRSLGLDGLITKRRAGGPSHADAAKGTRTGGRI